MGINNLFDEHSLVGISPAAGDFLTLMAGRSVSVSMTLGYAPKK